MKLWYRKPAEDWNKALPIGNGRLGGMVYAGIGKEHIQLNEDSVWYGGPRDRNNPDTIKYLDEIRELIFAGKISQAEELAALAMSGIPENQRHYEPFVDLEIKTGHDDKDVESYRRELDIEKAIARTEYQINGINYKREYFASAVDQVILVKFTADQQGKINAKARLRRLGATDKIEQYSHYLDEVYTVENNTIICNGGSGGCNQQSGINFHGGLKVKTRGGTIKLIGETIIIEGADEAIFIVGAATNYYHDDPESILKYQLESVIRKDYQEILTEHINDYQYYYNRISLDLDGEDYSNLPTDERLSNLAEGNQDLNLITLYFNYGRYLLISSSRPGTQAATLQGIWNNKWLPSWDSKYTININLQMNYWPAEICNLAEMHQPLFDLIKRLRSNGKHTAREMYNAAGFCAHHNTDIWGDTAPQGNHIPSTYWPMGAAWLCTHLWEHYLYNPDENFLQEVYLIMKEACIFFFDYLVKDSKGRLVTCPSVSPENTYILPNGERGNICSGPAMDSQIISTLLSQTMRAAEILEVDDDFRKQAEEVKELLPDISIGKQGQIMEWADDYEEAEPGHRHISHLWALYPGNSISLIDTPKLADAAKITLERRLKHGGGHTGWSRAWIINFWARLFDGEKAFENILALLKKSTLDNLLDNHPPFQIDGNFGGTAGIAEMLLQSHNGLLHILPALPAAWDNGQLKGLCARGGYQVNIYWENNNLKKLVISSKYNNTCKIRYKDKVKEVNMKAATTYHFNSHLEFISNENN